ncbi:HlyD family secretion protein [Pseudochryseolinea flava]|uniref:HlyD family secretion protein n=1 Tax=Pseudochryseolinea flava TaxID=2059302 RepID=A0A364XX40_9BACT|nr:HlyD family secretion protein [Pseudochryseolinea flava]RAV98796.1 HlyD family secretion protein [Pseudochryseolinea flava]
MENTTPPKKKSPAIFIVLGVLAIGAFFGVRSLIHRMQYESTDNAQIESRSVPVISRVPGFIDSLQVDDYGHVQAGTTLIKIDDHEYRLAVMQAKADLMNAEADLANAQAAYQNSLAAKRVAAANAAVQKTRLDKAQNDLKRDEALVKEGAITQKQSEDSQSNFDATSKQYAVTLEQVNLASTQVATGEAQIKKAQALIDIRRAALETATLKLTYCTITAPVSGKIGKRNVERGQYINPGAPLFSIVNDERFWLVANFKETQLEKMKEGQHVSIKLDGYPDLDIEGSISSFSQATGAKFSLLPPDNATGNFVKVTQRVPVRIDIVHPEKYKRLLRAGLSAEVEVKVN